MVGDSKVTKLECEPDEVRKATKVSIIPCQRVGIPKHGNLQAWCVNSTIDKDRTVDVWVSYWTK